MIFISHVIMSLRGQQLQQFQQRQQQIQQSQIHIQLQQQQQHQQLQQGVGVTTMQNKSVAIVTPQRSNSMDYLNFEEKRQLIASSLSLSDIIHCGPAAAAKEVAANTIIGRSFDRQILCKNQKNGFLYK